MHRLLEMARRGEDSSDASDPSSTVVIAVQGHGAIEHRSNWLVRVKHRRNRLRFGVALRSASALPSNNRFERSREVAPSLSQGGESMIEIKHLRLAPTQARVAQPHR
jgi:uncharacterized protein (DUF1786 family)